MTNDPTRSWSRVIAHVDGDAFFASVEQAVKPYLKGKPVVTGKERNIVAAASYEAKALGIKRGVTLWDAKKMCKDLVVLPTDYETVSLFSKRMYEIMRRYTPAVEEYSIDEAFIDLTGLRRVHRGSYTTIAKRIQTDINTELGITVTVGLSVNKVLTKIASSLGKPAGFTVISAVGREGFLREYPINEVWGIGPSTAALLKGHGMNTALQFAQKDLEYLKHILTKPGLQTWQELNGELVMPIETGRKVSYQSISKVKTFTPPSEDKEYVYAQLIKNVENACIKARRYHQATQKIVIFLKRHDHRTFGIEGKLERSSAYPKELTNTIRHLFDTVFESNTAYRATGFIMKDLVSASPTQPTLFEEPNKIKSTRRLYKAIDELRDKYGKHVLHLASSLPAQKSPHLTRRGDAPKRKHILLRGETKRRRLPLPMLQVKLS